MSRDGWEVQQYEGYLTARYNPDCCNDMHGFVVHYNQGGTLCEAYIDCEDVSVYFEWGMGDASLEAAMEDVEKICGEE
jgi:hypothetical protein